MGIFSIESINESLSLIKIDRTLLIRDSLLPSGVFTDIQRSISTDYLLYLFDNEELEPFINFSHNKDFSGVNRILLKSGSMLGLQPRLVHRGATWSGKSGTIPYSSIGFKDNRGIVINRRPGEFKEWDEYLSGLMEQDYKDDGGDDTLFNLTLQLSVVNIDRSYFYAQEFTSKFGADVREMGKRGQQIRAIKYLLAYIEGVLLNKVDSAVIKVRELIMGDATEAAFWCLLGDLYFKLGGLVQAREMYENAISLSGLASRRLDTAIWVDLEKYDSHPRTMIQRC